MLLLMLAATLSLTPATANAQAGGGRRSRALARTDIDWRIDLTGQWISAVTDDWNYRILTPAKGDYAGVPLNAEGLKMAGAWDPAKDEAAGEQCKAYGAPAILRFPGRLRISWADTGIMKLETDAGTQTRLFYFNQPENRGGGWQGVSHAAWDVIGRTGPVRGGSMKVITTKLRAGYLRKNGVPYSDNAVLTEYYDRTTEPNGDGRLIVTSVVEDPTYLAEPLITNTYFKRENDESGWNPTACSAR